MTITSSPLRPTMAMMALAGLLAACSLPPLPGAGGPPVTSSGVSTASSPAASPTASGRLATVTGTGRFGLSIRNAPGMGSSRVATVPDGFQASVVAGPVNQDGVQWYQIQAPDVSGWASAAYLSIGAGSATASNAPAPAPPNSSPAPSASGAAVRAAATPLAGILAQLNRDSNYDVKGNGIFVEAPLKPAVDHLGASPTGQALLERDAPVYLRLTIAHFPATSEGGEFSTLGHSIKVGDTMMRETLDVQATVISHELQHASDILVDHATPETSQDCLNLELRAFQTEEKVWLELTTPSPAQTKMEDELDSLSHVVGTPAFAQRLAAAYAGECGSYGNGSPPASIR